MKLKLQSTFLFILFLIITTTSCDGYKPSQEVSSVIPNDNVMVTIGGENTSMPAITGIVRETLSPGEVDSLIVPYLVPQSVSPKDFSFGDYALMAADVQMLLTDGAMPAFDYALLYDNVTSFDEGKMYYKKLDAVYDKKYPMPAEIWDHYVKAEQIQAYFYKRHVTMVSPEGDKVLCASPVFDTDVVAFAYDLVFLRKFECFEKGALRFTLTRNEPYYTGYSTHGFPVVADDDALSSTFFNIEHTEYVNLLDGYGLRSKEGFEVCSYPDQQIISIVRPTKKAPNATFEFFQLTDTQILYGETSSYDGQLQYFDVYLIDIDGQNKRAIGQYMCEPLLSPDEKYLAYRSPYKDDFDFPYEGKYDDIPFGIFIMNLETGETTLYPSVDSARVICWAKKAGIDGLIKLG